MAQLSRPTLVVTFTLVRRARTIRNFTKLVNLIIIIQVILMPPCEQYRIHDTITPIHTVEAAKVVYTGTYRKGERCTRSDRL